MKHPLVGAGKGDKPRSVDKKRYGENYDRIFGKREIKTFKPADNRCKITEMFKDEGVD